MSLDALIPIVDTPVMVGALMRAVGGVKIPFFLIDFGKDHPSPEAIMRRNRKITLDITPLGADFTFRVTGSRVISELSAELLSKALDAPKEKQKQILFSNGHPEFATCVTMCRESYDAFTEARDGLSGHWLLILLGECAIEIVISESGEVGSITSCERKRYEPFFD